MKLEIITTPIADVLPYAKNARTHSPEQVEQIAASINEFGFNNPVLIDERGTIIAGHGRVMAAHKLNLEDVPTITLGHMTDAQRRAYIIADNKLALNAGWDLDVLRTEMDELKADDFDLSLIGFDDFELGELFDDDETAVDNIPQDVLNEVWREWAGSLANEFQTLVKSGVAFSGINVPYAKIMFLKAKHNGMEYPRHCSLAFHPQQFTTNGDLYSAHDGLNHVESGLIKADRLRFVVGDAPRATRLISGSLPFAGARMPLDFPASLARDLINEFATDGRVLDPCAGWGGRVVGFMLSNALEYVGIDVSPLQCAGVQETINALLPLSDSVKDASVITDRFEDAKLGKALFDFALTSPPYFDVETYEGGKQSHSEFDAYESWRDGFYRTLIEKTFAALKAGGVFALQVGSQRYPLLTDGENIGKDCGFSVIDTRPTKMHNSQAQTDDDKAELILLLQKPSELIKENGQTRAETNGTDA